MISCYKQDQKKGITLTHKLSMTRYTEKEREGEREKEERKEEGERGRE